MKSTVIVSFARTPIGKFRGSLSSLKAPELGAIAIKGAIARMGMDHDLRISEAFMGNVVSAGIGQAPCRQAGEFNNSSLSHFS
jgi:acetyl-CoA C-acetyltransferase